MNYIVSKISSILNPVFWLPFILPTSVTWLPSSPTPCRGGMAGIPELSVPSLSLPFPEDAIGKVENGRSGLKRCKLWESGSPNLLPEQNGRSYWD